MDTLQENLSGQEDADSTSAETVRDYEAEARSHGWTPKEDFRGDAARWVDAETFVKRADEVMPFLKKQNAGLKRELDDLKRQVKKASEFFTKAEERGYARAMDELQRQHDDAVETGDVQAARKAMKEMGDLQAEIATAKADFVEDKPTETADPRAEFAAWVEDNDWYVTDENKRMYADLQAQAMGPAESWAGGHAAWLAEIKTRTERKFAEKKPNPANPIGNRAGASARGSKTFADLPPAAKALADKWVKQKIIASRDDYVKNYQWD